MPDSFDLAAGPLTMEFSGGDLRNIRCGGAEIINRIYFALRDENWGTIAGNISGLSLERSGGGFLLTYRSEHRAGEIHFVWDAEIRGEEDGRLSFRVDGEARSPFRRNRIGLCVLHPASAAGDRVDIVHPEGSREKAAFPELVSPHQPFRDIAAIHHHLPRGLEAEITFSGEVFETEDQRNWTDGTYKTYGTPLSLPFPVEVGEGERVTQTVVISVGGRLPAAVAAPASPPAKGGRPSGPEEVHVTVEPGSGSNLRLPELGFSYGREPGGLSDHALERLRKIRPAFLGLELLLGEAQWRTLFEAAARDSQSCGIALSLTLRVGADAERELGELLESLSKSGAPVRSWTILSEGAPTTRREHLEVARRRLEDFGAAAPIGGGTRAFFAELNRNRPRVELLDFLTFTINPQVHAFDDLSIVETLEGQRAAVRSARVIAGEKAIHIGSITLKPQWNPNATAPPAPPPPGELPVEVDPRQRTAFAAAWTLGSIKALAESGVEAACYYEVEGWKGLMERPSGPVLPLRFPSRPNELFPVYELFRALAPAAGAELVTSTCDAPLRADALVARVGDGLRAFLMNHTGGPLRVVLAGVRPDGEVTRIVPSTPGGAAPALERVEGGVALALDAHAVCAVDCAV